MRHEDAPKFVAECVGALQPLDDTPVHDERVRFLLFCSGTLVQQGSAVGTRDRGIGVRKGKLPLQVLV